MEKKALFLDRDGVINLEKNYVHKIVDFDFQTGIFETLRFYQSKGYLLIVITNQAGIAKGYYTEKDFHILNNWMLDEFKKNNIDITKVYYCPYHKDGKEPYNYDSFDRKPNPGMIIKARDELNIKLEESILVGDQESDIMAGINSGIGTTILFVSERLDRETKAKQIIHELTELIDVLPTLSDGGL